MWAALRFAEMLAVAPLPERIRRVQVDLFGSPALTGRGHAADRAVVFEPSGFRPDVIDPDVVEPQTAAVRRRGKLPLAGRWEIDFCEPTDLVFHEDVALPRHPNGMRLTAEFTDGRPALTETFYSVGGGFVVAESDAAAPTACCPAD